MVQTDNCLSSNPLGHTVYAYYCVGTTVCIMAS